MSDSQTLAPRHSAPYEGFSERILEQAKAFIRPVRNSIERMKFVGAPILSGQRGNDYLADLAGQPVAIGRFGASELGAVVHYLSHKDNAERCESWGRHAVLLHRNAGVYPATAEIFSRFCRLYLDQLRHLDALGVWMRPGERWIQRHYSPSAALMELRALEPYYHDKPWTERLAGRRVVVVSPFVSTIEHQYQRRHSIWADKPNVLPAFQLRGVRVPLSAALVTPATPDWFSALDEMRREMDREPFDAAVIGAGAWSLPLVVHAKSRGAMGVHMGGATQILFGVRGKRWERNKDVARYFNDDWVRPSPAETPESARTIENGCYW